MGLLRMCDTCAISGSNEQLYLFVNSIFVSHFTQCGMLDSFEKDWSIYTRMTFESEYTKWSTGITLHTAFEPL